METEIEKKVQRFEIRTRLPSLNEYIDACRRNRYEGARLKAGAEDIVTVCAKSAKIKPVYTPCSIRMTFHEPNRRRDVDNVESAKKYILDALVRCGIIERDSPRWVTAAPSYTDYNGCGVTVEIIAEQARVVRARTAGVYLWSKPGGKQVGILDKGARVEILEERLDRKGAQWCRTESGWVTMDAMEDDV